MSDENSGVQPGEEEWENQLLQFVQRFFIGFLKLELLVLFYRDAQAPLTADDVVRRTGYHVKEVESNLNKLVEQGLLAGGPLSGLFQRLPDYEFTGREDIQKILQRLIREFNTREGRLKIIYALLKAQEK
jgi:hypothetical protein